MSIQQNAALVNLDGLAGVMSVGDDLRVLYNPVLSRCACGLYALIDSGGVDGQVQIEYNAPGCNSAAEIEAPPPGSCATSTAADPALTDPALTLSVGPNPSATAVSVRFRVSEPGVVRATVVDRLGRTVARVWDGPARGEVAVGIDVSAWAPGGYSVQVVTESGTRSVAFTVVRSPR